MLTFMRENKRLLNIHEQKFVKLAAFQANTTVSGQYQLLFEEFGDSGKPVDPSYVESTQGYIPK